MGAWTLGVPWFWEATGGWNPPGSGRGQPGGRNTCARVGFRADRKRGRTRCRDSGPWAAMEAALTDMYDQALLGILQHVGNVEEFLRILFGFLYRKTDFYRLLLRPGDRLGFPPGAAQAMALQVPAGPGEWRGLALLAAGAVPVAGPSRTGRVSPAGRCSYRAGGGVLSRQSGGCGAGVGQHSSPRGTGAAWRSAEESRRGPLKRVEASPS